MASEGDTYGTITLKGTPITELRVTDIKRELEKRGLSKSGSKTQLSDRLKAQLLLEKLQQDAAQSSGDEHEGKVPNMALQRDDKAGQSEFVRQYLQQQQRNLEIQREMKKQVEEERKLKSGDESSADESKNAVGSQAEPPDVTSEKQFKDDTSNAPAKEGAKMSKPARKSSRNSSKDDNGQEGAHARKRSSQSPVAECDRPKDRAQSRSSSSSRSPSPSSDKNSRSRRGRSSRGRVKRGGVKRGGHQNRSRSSSSSTSPEVIPKKNQKHRTNSSSRSRSPQIISPEVSTRRSSRHSSTSHKATPDHVQEKDLPQDGSGDKFVEKAENVDEHLPSAPKKRWRKKPSSEVKNVEPYQPKDDPTKSLIVTTSVLHTADSTNEGKELEGEKKSNAEKVTESSLTVPEPLRKITTLVKGTETKLSKDSLTETAVSLEIIAGAVTSTTSSDKSQETEKVKGNELASVKGDSSKRPISKEQASLRGNKELISVNKDVFTEKVELDKNKSVSENTNEADRLSKIREENVQTREVDQTDSPIKNENRGIPSPPRKTQRHSSYSSDSSSVESRSQSKSPIRKKQSRSGSSSSSSSNSRSSSSSSSTDVSSPEKSKIGSQAQTRGKDGHPRPASLSPERIVHTDRDKIESNKKNAPVPRNTDYHRKDDKASTPAAVVGVLKSKSQEESQKLPGKEQEDRSLKAQQELMHVDPDASRDSVSNADADEETVAKKGIKKRKWGSKTSKAAKTTKRTSSMEISSDVLKNLIGDVKLTETVFEMETEVINTLDYDENEEDRRDVKVKRNITQDVIQSPPQEEEEGAKPEQEDARRVETRDEYSPEPAEIPSEPEKKIIKLSSAAPKVKTKLKDGKKKKDEKKKESSAGKENKGNAVSDKESRDKVFATTRPTKPLLPVVDEPEPVSSSQSPARNSPDRVIRIAGLVRPFTVGQLKELLRRSGELDDEYFWINAIKSHCLAAYKTQEDAVAARAALHGTRWPQSNPKILIVDFATVEDVIHRKTEGDVPLPALIKKPPLEDQKKLKEQKVDEEKEKKQKSREQREKGRVEREKVEREKRDTREQKREPEKKNPVREWDRDKIQQLSRSRSKSKERERLNRRSRSKDREQRKRRDPSKEKKVEGRRREKKLKDTKAEDEPPAKLLDDLFRKTKATPCIYWLPLTEEQAQQRIVKKLELEKERQKRIAAVEEREKEELKKRETARLERQREREKARDKSRERERDKGRQERSRSYSRSRSRRRR